MAPTPPRSSARWALFACTIVAYAVALRGPFQFDDAGVIVRDTSVHSLSTAVTSLGGLRPLLKLSYAFCWALGQSPVSFHVFNLLVHLFNVELMLRLYTAATDRSTRWPFSAALEPGALFAALLFALHPIQTEAVAYISGRSAALSSCFLMLALLLYAEGVRSRRAGYWLGLTALAFAAALGSKETSATLPLGLLLWELVVERSRAKDALRHVGPWFALGALTAVLLVMHPRYFALLYNVIGKRSLLESLRYQLGGLGYLGGRLSLLEPLCIDPGLWLKTPSTFVVAASAAAIVAALGLGGVLLRQRPLVLFGVGWFLLQVFVPFVLLPRVEVINERHAYVGNVGLFLACGALWDVVISSASSKLWRLGVPTGLALALAALTVRRNLDYRSEVELWESTTAAAPQNPRAQNNLGVAYLHVGRRVEAQVTFTRALLLEPRYAAALDNLARLSSARSTLEQR